MATFRKRTNKWQAIVRNKALGTKSKSFSSKALAIKWAIELEESIERNKHDKLLPAETTLSDLLSRYKSEITPQKRGSLTEARRINRLLKDPISLTRVDKLTSQRLALFRDRRLSDGIRTCQYDLIIIRHCIKIAIFEWGLDLYSNPVDFVKLPPTSKPRQRRLRKEEYNSLVVAAEQTQNPHILPVINFAIETGMRRGEILSLQWGNVFFEKKIASLHLTKNGDGREVPLSSKALSILKQQRKYPSPFPVTSNAFRLAWDRLRKRANIVDFKFHDLRHEAVSRFFELGLSMPEVAAISGHKDPRMLFRYTHLKAENIVEKIG